MGYRPKPVDVDEDVVAIVVMEGIFDTMELMAWNHHKWNNTEVKQENGKSIQNKPSSKAHENNCHRCGMKGHWSRTYRTPKHLVDLYQESIKEK